MLCFCGCGRQRTRENNPGYEQHKRLPGEDEKGFKASASKEPAKSGFYHVVSVPLTPRCAFAPQ